MVTDPGSPGLFGGGLLPSIGGALTSFISPALGSLGNTGGNWLKNSLGGNKVGQNSLPSFQNASPQSNNGFSSSLPNFNSNMR